MMKSFVSHVGNTEFEGKTRYPLLLVTEEQEKLKDGVERYLSNCGCRVGCKYIILCLALTKLPIPQRNTYNVHAK